LNEKGIGGHRYPPKPTPYQGFWMEEQGPELPLELTEMVDHTPDSQMYFKTLKGASLLVKERDTAEEMILTDRMGAELRFESHTNLIENGVLRRGRASATQHEPMSLDNLVHSHKTMLVSANRSGMEIENNLLGDNNLSLQVHPTQDTVKNPELCANRCAVELNPGEDKVKIIWVEDGAEIGYIEFDGVSRRLNIKGLDFATVTADKAVTLEAPEIKLVGDVEVDGEIKHFGGKKLSFMDNDMEPYGSQAQNWWASDDPYQDEWGENHPVTQGYKR
jgi:hypothetical protein